LVRAHPEDHREEFTLSGSAQNPDLTARSVRLVLSRIGRTPARTTRKTLGGPHIDRHGRHAARAASAAVA
jgi:hypothetical protein